LFDIYIHSYFYICESQVGAHILGSPEKAFWKNCLLSENEETDLAGKFRDLFEKYDFTL
jgi:hypothetical protein